MPHRGVKPMDEMSNGNGHNDTSASLISSNLDARFGILSQRTTNLESSFSDFRREVSANFTHMNNIVGQISTKLDERFNSMLAQNAERSRTPWGVIFSGVAVLITFFAIVGGMAYAPVLTNQSRMETAFLRYVEVATNDIDTRVRNDVFNEFKNTTENNRVVSRNDLNARFDRIDQVLANQVPRAEHERVWTSIDQRFAELQRQLDEVKQSYNGIFNARDAMENMQRRIDRLESENRSLQYRPQTAP